MRQGSSPRARGNSLGLPVLVADSGSILAACGDPCPRDRRGTLLAGSSPRAGNTDQVLAKYLRTRAHPRARGEHHRRADHARKFNGPSPRARGTPCPPRIYLPLDGCSRPRGNAEFWTRVDRKMLWWPGHRQTDRFRVCSPASRRVAALRPRFRGAHGLDAGSAHAVQTCPCLTMPHSRPPRCCGRPSVQIDAVSDDR